MEESTQHIGINGMTCQSCVRNIENTITKLNGIRSIKVSLEDKLGIVIFDSNTISINNIVERINQMGFNAELNQTIQNDNLDVELGGISDENIPISIERISLINGVLNVKFPFKNDSTHAQISYNKNQIDTYTLY
ncbi:unnamed protein product, partial [Rotaria sp. Silwood2]